MTDRNAAVTTTLRIPGNWSHPRELIERMPQDVRLTPEVLILPNGIEIEFTPMPPDDQFAEIFQSACRRPATADELAVVKGYTVNVILSGPGGDMQSARAMLDAGAAVVRAGGAGVFVDNGAVAHGGGSWIEMADDGGPEAVSFAFVGIVRGQHDVRTMGMHVMGLPDIVMKRADLDPDGSEIIEVICYLCEGGKAIGDGHLLGDELGPRFQATASADDRMEIGSPMHNPFGRLTLVSVKDIAERN